MNQIVFLLMLSLALAGLAGADAEAHADERGALIIAGGAIEETNEAVWNTFLAHRDGEGPVVLVPSSSGAPMSSARATAKTLSAYSINPDKIIIAPLANVDDPASPDIDESGWATNASDPDVVALFETASAIWFTGGDQARTASVLLTDEGHDTPALDAIRTALANGVAVGGTSAGAAIMSDPMIVQGDSMAALTQTDGLEPVKLGPGMGFFEFGLVDQHFGERARLGRLVYALTKLPDNEPRYGFGVDEDTAFLVRPDGSADVLGSGYVTVIDASRASVRNTSDGSLAISGVTIGLAAHGDTIDLSSLEIAPAEGRKPTILREYFDRPLPSGGGIALAGQSLATLLGEGLVDNSASTEVSAVSFLLTGEATRFDFRQTDKTAGYWGRTVSGEARFTVAGVELDIVPMRIRLEEFE